MLLLFGRGTSSSTFRPSISYFSRHASLPRLKGLSPQQIQAAKYVAESAPKPIKELVQLRDVIFLLNQTNKHNLKKHILSTYAGSLEDLIQFIYNPRTRMNVTSKTLISHMEEHQLDFDAWISNTGPEGEYSNILSILQELNSKTIIGNAKLDKLGSFMLYLKGIEARVKDDQLRQKATLQDIFLRCLDRNFRAGISLHTIQEVYGNNKNSRNALPKLPGHLRKGVMQQKRFDEVISSAEEVVKQKGEHESMEGIQGQASMTADPIQESRIDVLHGDSDMKETSKIHWSIALGKPSTLEQLQSLIGDQPVDTKEGKDSWYLSRKLDGVRCVIRIGIQGDGIPLTITNIETLSRSGKSFTSLKILTDNLGSLISHSNTISKMIERIPVKSNGRRSVYFDGELCALIPQKEGVDGYMEDFNGIVGLVRRQDYTVQNAAYFPFDILTQVEFEDWKDEQRSPEQHQPFYLRKKRVEEFLKHCQVEKSVSVRLLEQQHVTDSDQIKKAAEEAASKGWEGLIMRKGDLYQGKRSSSIRKYKQWQDAEYKVVGVQKAIMRLPVDQVYDDREALANVTIRHKGTEVLVGSGFTVEQRLRYAKDPEAIIGKDITVQYFGESTSSDRASKEETSLRFPRIKKVWEEGQRTM